MRSALITLSVLVLTSCGGSGSSSSVPSPEPALNTSPYIADPGLLEVVEGTTTITTLSVSDADGDSVTLGLSGSDADALALSAAGALTFVAAPDFEDPTDTDSNNRYDVVVTAADAQATTNQSVSVDVLNAVEGRIVDAPVAGHGVSGYQCRQCLWCK